MDHGNGLSEMVMFCSPGMAEFTVAGRAAGWYNKER